ncbi:MAG: hypothetical protein AVDCRST_MAG32-1527, partial [uncultured Nocardioides sp.]
CRPGRPTSPGTPRRGSCRGRAESPRSARPAGSAAAPSRWGRRSTPSCWTAGRGRRSPGAWRRRGPSTGRTSPRRTAG